MPRASNLLLTVSCPLSFMSFLSLSPSLPFSLPQFFIFSLLHPSRSTPPPPVIRRTELPLRPWGSSYSWGSLWHSLWGSPWFSLWSLWHSPGASCGSGALQLRASFLIDLFLINWGRGCISLSRSFPLMCALPLSVSS